jgi:ankyrin repeat protein
LFVDSFFKVDETLHEAVRVNDLTTCKSILASVLENAKTGWEQNGDFPPSFVAYVNQPDSNGRRPMDYAAAIDGVQIGKLLLANGADPNIPDVQGRPPLLWAAYVPCLPLVCCFPVE